MNTVYCNNMHKAKIIIFPDLRIVFNSTSFLRGYKMQHEDEEKSRAKKKQAP